MEVASYTHDKRENNANLFRDSSPDSLKTFQENRIGLDFIENRYQVGTTHSAFSCNSAQQFVNYNGKNTTVGGVTLETVVLLLPSANCSTHPVFTKEPNSPYTGSLMTTCQTESRNRNSEKQIINKLNDIRLTDVSNFTKPVITLTKSQDEDHTGSNNSMQVAENCNEQFLEVPKLMVDTQTESRPPV